MSKRKIYFRADAGADIGFGRYAAGEFQLCFHDFVTDVLSIAGNE